MPISKSTTRTAVLTLLTGFACSPSYPSAGAQLAAQRVEVGMALEVDVRFCVEGKVPGDPHVEASATIGVDAQSAEPSRVVVIDGTGEEADTGGLFNARTNDDGDEVRETFVYLLGDVPFAGNERRCGDAETIRVEYAGTERGGDVRLDVAMEIQSDDADDGVVASIELGTPRLVRLME